MVVALALLAGGFYAHYTSAFVRKLTQRSTDPVRLAVLTKPAMLFTYTPATRKGRVTVAAKACNSNSKSTCFGSIQDAFFVPKEQSQHAFWTQFGNQLDKWRFTPTLAWNYVREYINALIQRRTNLRPSEFLLLSKELIELTRTDFVVEYPAPTKKKKPIAKTQEEKLQEDTKPEIILPNVVNDERPLVVEVLNASGIKGLALRVTQYLREQNAKGLLRIDVIQYDNYPSVQDESFIVDYSGKQVQVSQASQALGIRGEIRSEKSTTAICDTRIVLGKDFKMPL